MSPSEPPQDAPSPTPRTESIIDPAIPAGQHQIVVIRRHPFGLIALYLQTAVGLVIAFGLIFFLLPSGLSSLDPNRTSVASSTVGMIAVVVVAIAVIFLMIATFLYRQNRWIVTDDSITQVLRSGLFSTKTSGLSMANIEDISSDKNGIFAAIFGFGTLEVETAGEVLNFHFFYCPRPDMYAKILLDARERFINSKPEQAERANEMLNVPRG